MILDEPFREQVRITDIYENRLLTRHERNEFGQLERKQVEMRYRRPVQTQSTSSRFVNLIIDAIALFVIESVIQHFFSYHTIFNWAIFTGYYFFFELFFQRTLGKLVTGSIVVDEYGEAPAPKVIFLRSLIRLIPFEPFSFLNNDRGWHDRWTDTYVLSLKELETIKTLIADPANRVADPTNHER